MRYTTSLFSVLCCLTSYLTLNSASRPSCVRSNLAKNFSRWFSRIYTLEKVPFLSFVTYLDLDGPRCGFIFLPSRNDWAIFSVDKLISLKPFPTVSSVFSMVFSVTGCSIAQFLLFSFSSMVA